MKILIVNSYDSGGAANACLRLHEGFLSDGVNSQVIVRHSKKNIPNLHIISPLQKKRTTFQKIKTKTKRILKELKIIKTKPVRSNSFLSNRSKNLELFSYPTSNFDITKSPLYKEADIINLHWVADFLDYKSFFEKNTKPVVWTLHDMNPFTGGEHYQENHLGIDENGKPFKRVVDEVEKAEVTRTLKFKIDLMSTVNNLTVVAPSIWLANEAKKSEVFKNKNVLHIPYGLNKEVYSPREKEYSRNILKIPNEKKVILFVADSISNNRKGFVFLKKAFELLKRDDVTLCAIGKKNSALESIDNLMELGHINDERLMSIAYSAADVFVIPSLMDNLPNTVLESLMCGTPVIGFPVGGIPDMIQHGENGLLTKDISVAALLDTLTIFLDSTHDFNSIKIRENAVSKYNLNIQSRNYIELFETLLK